MVLASNEEESIDFNAYTRSCDKVQVTLYARSPVLSGALPSKIEPEEEEKEQSDEENDSARETKERERFFSLSRLKLLKAIRSFASIRGTKIKNMLTSTGGKRRRSRKRSTMPFARATNVFPNSNPFGPQHFDES